MAVNRTVLPRKGLIQSQHGLTGYEADSDANALLLDTNAVFLIDLLPIDLNLNGVVSGFTLSTSAGLTPGLTVGILYAQGKRYAPANAPAPGAATASATNFLWYNFTTGFYYNQSGIAGTAGDALVGQVVTSATAVTAVTQATVLFGQISLAPTVPGNFTVAHLLGRKPLGAFIQMTSGGAIWFQSATMFDATNLYLVASDSNVTGKALLW